jgi:hypothetical protein
VHIDAGQQLRFRVIWSSSEREENLLRLR